MSEFSDFPLPTDMEFDLRADMPLVTTKATATTGLPKLATTSSTLDYTTPSVGVPTGKNPYISSSSKPLGTVFIAVGSVVAFILLGFMFFHLFKSFSASSTAKKAMDYEKLAHSQYAKNNNNVYGKEGSDLSIFNSTEYQGATVTKLPLLSSSRQSLFGGNPDASSTSYSDVAPMSKHDTTNMFISPTKEMTYARHGGSLALAGSMNNLGVYGHNGSEASGSPHVSNRYSQVIPSLYIDETLANSDYNVEDKRGSASPQPRQGGSKRKTIPSMYLDDLLDE